VDRLHRIGQTKKVMVYRLVARTPSRRRSCPQGQEDGAVRQRDGRRRLRVGAMTAADIQELLS